MVDSPLVSGPSGSAGRVDLGTEEEARAEGFAVAVDQRLVASRMLLCVKGAETVGAGECFVMGSNPARGAKRID